MVNPAQKILVTGASGFIGSSLCKALVAEGQPVRAFYRPRADGSIPRLLQGLEIEHCTGDITDPTALARAMSGVRTVFHTAAKLGSGGNAETLYAVTVGGTRNVLEAAFQAGVERLVHTSSVAVLGVPDWKLPVSPQPIPVDEQHAWNFPPAWWRYGHGKYLAELVVQEYVARGLDAVIVNPAIVAGAGDVNRITGDILFRIASGRFFFSLPGGANVIHIDDVVAGHLAALTLGRTGERYILGGENLTHLAFHTLIAEVTGVAAPRFVLPAAPLRLAAGMLAPLGKAVPFSTSTLRKAGYFFFFDTTKARTELGFRATHSVKQAIGEAWAWYQQMGMARPKS